MASVLFISILMICMAVVCTATQPGNVDRREMNKAAIAADRNSVLTAASQETSSLYSNATTKDNSKDQDLLQSANDGIQDACLVLCSCDADKKHVDCSARGLTSVPQMLPLDVQHLDLSQNNISEVREADVKPFSDLQVLDLSFNQLYSLSVLALSENNWLAVVYLQGNHLGNIDITCPEANFERVLNSTNVSLGVCNMMSLHLLDLSKNNLINLPDGILDAFPQLQILILDENNLIELPSVFTHGTHSLTHLSMNNNNLWLLNCSSLGRLSELATAHFSNNRLHQLPDVACFQNLLRLRTLSLSGNPINALYPGAFISLPNLNSLHLTHLPRLHYLQKYAFSGLQNLKSLNISYSKNLQIIHANAFAGLDTLDTLDISHCGISWMSKDIVENNTFIVRLEGNPWHCDRDLIWLSEWLKQQSQDYGRLQQNVTCATPPSLAEQNIAADGTVTSMMMYESPDVIESNITLWFKIASSAVIDCVITGSAKTKITWITPKHQIFVYDPRYQDLYKSDPERKGYHDGHYWHKDTSYYPLSEQKDHFSILYNGSLYIDYVTRKDAGNYTCIAENSYLNDTVIIEVRLDYSALSWLKAYTMIWGFICAFSFFFIAMTASTIRYYTIKCSSEERMKRKSIREVLDSLQDFKTVQIDRLCAYKTAKINKFSAFKTDKMHKLVAFKSAKIDKLRNYKQVTVASIFHHLEKMREHYNYQMNRVKDNCTQQVEKLRENYSSQVIRIKDYKSEKMDQIRDNYNSQVLKIKEYRAFQMNKLRDQYKLQQQHLLKLMELLDIGNCLNIVEAECMRTESMIFDPNISIDLEAEPVHVQRDMDLSDIESEYMTAGSQSNLSVSDTTITAGVFPPQYSGDSYEHCLPQQRHDSEMQWRYYKKGAGDRAKRSSDTSSSSSGQSSPSQFCVQVIPEALPPAPMFSSEIPKLNNIPLDHLVASIESDILSIYHTPPSSAKDSGQLFTAEEPPPQDNEARKSLTDSASTGYDTAGQSREESPDPSHSHLSDVMFDHT